MNVLAFDLATKCGWATNTPQGILCKTQKLKNEMEAYTFFCRTIEWQKPDVVVHEGVSFSKYTLATMAHGSYRGLLRLACQQACVPLHTVEVKTLKLHATGKGNANKQMMIDAARARGWQPIDDNAADAAWVLDYWLENNG